MKKIAVYTSIFSDNEKPYDLLKEVNPSFKEHADFFCFTNTDFESDTWKREEVTLERTPRTMARTYKTLPHTLMPDYEYHMWVDASIEILVDPKTIIDEYLKEHDVAAFLHPDRTCAYHEGEMIKHWRLDEPDVIDNQLDFMRRSGFPTNMGLCETGVVIRRNTSRVRNFNEEWYIMITLYSLRDQVSFNYCLWKTGISYNTFDGLTNVQSNSPIGSVQTKLFRLHNHNR